MPRRFSHTPDSQPGLFDAPADPIAIMGNEAMVVRDGIERGRALAEEFMRDPDSFGADWPSAALNRQAREESGVQVTETATDTASLSEDPHIDANGRAILGSRAQQRPATPAPKGTGTVGPTSHSPTRNAEGRSNAGHAVRRDIDNVDGRQTSRKTYRIPR